QVPQRRVARLHQAHHRPRRRDRAGEGQPRLRERPAARRAVRAAGLHPHPPVRPLRVSLRLLSHRGAARILLRHGRQPRQLAGQPLLGLRQAREDPGQGLPDLLVVERRPALAQVETPGQLAPVAPLDAWAPRADRLGAYVHVPFCTKRCGYCSFNTAPYLEAAVPRFLRALDVEIALAGAAPWSTGVRLRTVFLGGGTPSLLAPDELAGVLDALRARFGIEPDAEITVECNPESVSAERLAGYRAAGVTRISLGVQSLDDRVLPTLDRLPSAADARRAFDGARAAGFPDVSLDLIYGLPGDDGAGWQRTVREALPWAPDHLSAYALSLDEGSAWTASGW